LGLVARLRLGLGDYEEAHRLLQRQASIIATLDSPPASLRLQAASNLGRTLRLMGRSGACVDTLQPLLSLASHESRRLPVLTADSYSQLGRCQRDQGNREAARALFLRSL